MGSSSNTEVRVPIGIPVETDASKAADDFDDLRASVDRSKDAIKEQTATLRMLRGTSADVKAAKDQVKAAIEKERQLMSDATLKMLQHEAAMKKSGMAADSASKSVKKLSDATKAASKDSDKLKKSSDDDGKSKKSAEERTKAYVDALSKAHPAVGMLFGKMKQVSEIASKGGDLGTAALAAAGLTAAALAAGAAVLGVVVALTKWALAGADAARSMGLVREGSTRTSADAKALGNQVDALALKVPTATANLNELAASLARSRLGGQVTVDTLNAVAQANAGIGDQAGAKLREIVERGRLVNRMFIGMQELNGTGIDVDDIAKALADRMHVSVQKARQALAEGRVVLGDGAAAMRAAVEKKLGGINARKMLSLEGLSDMFTKLSQGLTKDLVPEMDKLGAAAGDFLHSFDQSTATGAAMKRMTTDFGRTMVDLMVKATPLAKSFLREMIIGAQRTEIQYLKFRIAISDAINAIEKPLKAIGFLDALDKIDAKGKVASAALFVLTTPLHTLEATFGLVAVAVERFSRGLEGVEKVYDRIAGMASKGTGNALVDGIVKGMTSGDARVLEAAKGLAKSAQRGFRTEAEIHSPSKKMERDGYQLPAGQVKGMKRGQPEVEQAAKDMVPEPKYAQYMQGSGGPSSSGAGGGAPVVHLTIQSLTIGGGGMTKDGGGDPGLRTALTQMLKEAAAQAGIALASVTVGGGG